MIPIQTCTIVLEFNYGKPNSPSMGSVWLSNGDATAALQQSAPLENAAGWIKIVGPVDYDLASGIQAALKSFFKQQGVVVIDEAIAD